MGIGAPTWMELNADAALVLTIDMVSAIWTGEHKDCWERRRRHNDLSHKGRYEVRKDAILASLSDAQKELLNIASYRRLCEKSMKLRSALGLPACTVMALVPARYAAALSLGVAKGEKCR